MPIHGPQACADCPLRQAAWSETALAAAGVGTGRVVAFPSREAVAATG